MPAVLQRALERWRASDPLRADGLLAAGIAAVAVAAFWLTPAGPATGISREADALGSLLIAATAVPLAWRRAAPVAALLAALALSLAVVLSEYAAVSVQFTLAFALVSAAAHSSRATTVRLAALGVVAVVAAVLSAERTDTAPIDVLTVVAVVILPLVVGDLLRTERERAAAVRAQLARGAELRAAELETVAAAERVRIARDVHDIVGHHLSAIAVQAHAGRVALAQDAAQADRSLATIVAVAAEALGETRQALGRVRADTGGAAQPGLAALPELLDAARRDGMAVAYRVRGEPRPGSALVETILFRIVQEALTNVRRHGGDAAEVEVRFAPPGIELEVANACSVAATRGAAAGNGIAGMRERAALVGGRLDAGPRPGGRWLVRAQLPLGDRPLP